MDDGQICEDETRCGCKYILAVLARVFFIAAVLRLVRRLHPSSADADLIRRLAQLSRPAPSLGHPAFHGRPVTVSYCINVLRNGHQRQRILAAHDLCLLEPGTPLFDTSAPAWRQQRWLAKM